MSVAQMICEDTPVSYFDYENTTTPHMADTMECATDKRVVCEPVTSKKCAEVTYTRCQEVGLRKEDDQHNNASDVFNNPVFKASLAKLIVLFFRFL